MQTTEFNIPSMSCESCASKIESAVKQAGATQINFDFKTHNVTVTYDDNAVSSDNLKKVIKNAGYDVV